MKNRKLNSSQRNYIRSLKYLTSYQIQEIFEGFAVVEDVLSREDLAVVNDMQNI